MLNIGQTAKQGGVTVEALRYYEREGLIDAPDRDGNGYRRYAEAAVRHIRFIKRAQQVGFTLNEIKDLLSLQTDPAASCCDVRAQAADKVRGMEQKIAVLEGMKSVLSQWIEECSGYGPLTECPILDALNTGDEEDEHD